MPTETDKAVTWLLGFIGDEPASAAEVEQAAKAEGVAMRTLKTAKKHLGLLSVRENNQWWWLPQRPTDENVA